MASHGTITQTHFTPRAAARSGNTIWTVLATMLRARRTRRLLAEMDDRMLADVGLDRGQAHMEARRAMWDVQPRRYDACLLRSD